jgi:SAM-dependent methyltransferase
MTETRFNEEMYLTLHKDVRLAVERGDLQSGWDHYERYGKSEGRKVSRFDHDSHSITDYTRLVRKLIADHPGNPDLAMAKAVGAPTLENYRDSGDKHYHVLRRFGLQDGHAIYDLACGSGRTAAALKRHGWSGDYRGADIIPELVDYATQKNPGFRFFVFPDYAIHADDDSQDMVFSWSLFTHLQLEEIFLYAKDCLRVLKPDAIFVFSFLTLKDRGHRELFVKRATALNNGVASVHLDTFLDQETITILFGHMLGFKLLGFIDADDESATPGGCFGQALAVFKK